VPVYQTTSFVFDDTADAASLFALQKYGSIYSRIGNPTVNALEERLASLEGGIGAVATASGQAAEFAVFACLAGAGDHIVASANLYGGTVTQLDVTLRRFGVETTFVAGGEVDDLAAAITDPHQGRVRRGGRQPQRAPCSTSPPSPTWPTPHGVPLVVDATTVTPYLCRPIEHGADIVVHSVTKFLGGHGTTLGGVVVESGTVRLGQRPVPDLHRTGRRLRRAAVVGELRRVRLPHQAPQRAAPRHRRQPHARSRRSCCCRASRRCPSGWTPTWPTPTPWPPGCATTLGWPG
jgi:O-acetylhomoserine (thiol)-lyase